MQSSTPPQWLLRAVAGTLDPSHASRVSWYYVSFPNNRRRKMSCAAVKASSRLGSALPVQKKRSGRKRKLQTTRTAFSGINHPARKTSYFVPRDVLFFCTSISWFEHVRLCLLGSSHSLGCLIVFFRWNTSLSWSSTLVYSE